MVRTAISRRGLSTPARRRALKVGAWVAALGALAACGPQPLPAPPPIQTTLSRPLGSWAGRGGFQTEFFYSEHGKFRVRWETRALSAGQFAGADASQSRRGSPPSGQASATNPDEIGPYFELKLQSGVSGRQLGEAVERRHSDRGVLEFNEDPRDFYFAVRAHDMEWSFQVEEQFRGPWPPERTRAPDPSRVSR